MDSVCISADGEHCSGKENLLTTREMRDNHQSTLLTSNAPDNAESDQSREHRGVAVLVQFFADINSAGVSQSNLPED